MTPLLLAGVGLSLLWLLTVIAAGTIGRRLPELPDTARAPSSSVAAVIPARDEEAAVRNTIQSLLQQDHRSLEVIAVNDGSTDRTGEILDQIAEGNPRLTIIHDPPLPPGWLGKPNAQYRGAGAASADWLLFADADILFEPDAVRRGVAYAEEHQLDGLTLIPRLITGSWSEGALLPLLPLGVVALRPDTSNTSGTRGGFAAGAFMLVRKRVYESLGGHASVRNQVIEDVAFGRLLKQNGYGLRALIGTDVISIRMYTGFRSILLGLVKNISFVLGGNRGSPIVAPLAGLSVALVATAPLILLPLALARGDAAAVGAAGVAYLMPLAIAPALSRIADFRVWHLLTYPVAAWIMPLAAAMASYYRLRRGTVRWRDREVRLEPWDR